MGAAVVAIIAARQKQLIQALRARRAVTPATAIPEDLLPDWRHSMMRRMERLGLLRRAPGGVYLDEAALVEYERRQGRAALFLVFLAVVIAVIALVVRG